MGLHLELRETSQKVYFMFSLLIIMIGLAITIRVVRAIWCILNGAEKFLTAPNVNPDSINYDGPIYYGKGTSEFLEKARRN